MLMTIDPTHNHEYTSMLPEGEFYVISSPLLSQPDKEKNHSYSPTLRILIHNPECITKSILSGPVSNHNKCLIDLTVQHDDYHKRNSNHSYSSTIRTSIHNPECMAGSILSGPVSKHKKYLINLTTIVNLMITTQETIKNVIKNNRKNIRKSQITFKNLDLRSDITNQMFLSPIRSRHIRFPYPSYSAHIICMQPPPLTNHIFTLMNQPIPLLTPQSFCDLLTNNSKINDSTIQSFLHWLCSTYDDIHNLCTGFSKDLLQQRWQYAFHKYFLHELSLRYSHRACLKLTLSSPFILIPIHIHGALFCPPPSSRVWKQSRLKWWITVFETKIQKTKMGMLVSNCSSNGYMCSARVH